MSAVTIVRYENQVLPEATLKECLMSSTTLSMSFAVMAKDKQPYLAVNRMELQSTDQQLANLNKVLQARKDKQVCLYFDFPDGEVRTEELQPFVLLVNAEDKPAVVAYLENIQDPAQVVTDDLIPLMQEQFQIAKSDIPDLAKRTKEAKTFRSAMKGILGDTGVVTLHFSNGDSSQFAVADGAIQEEEWGVYTVSPDTGEGAVGAEPTVKEPVVEEIDEEEATRRMLAGEDTPVEPKTTGVHTTTAKPAPLNKPVASVPSGGSKDADYERVVPQPGMRQVDFVKWCAKRMDKVPGDAWPSYKQGKFFAIVAKGKPPVKDLKELGDALKNTTAPAIDPSKQPQPDVLPERKITPLPIPDIPKEVVEQVTATFLKDREIATLDVNSEAIHDPKFLKDVGQLKDSFAKQLGLPSMADTFGFDYEDVKKLLNSPPKISDRMDLAASFIMWLKFDLIKALQKMQKGGGRAAETPAAGNDIAAQRAAARAAAKAA